jgi:hypothetical protein
MAYKGPYRVGPWPGLTLRGAGVLLGCALLLALGQLLIGAPRTAVPDLPVLGLTALLPAAIAIRIVQTPGAASAVTAAYLLPRTLLSLMQPGLDLPPLLLVPALAFDFALWLRARDVAVTRGQSAFAGAVYGLMLTLVEPPFAIFLGGDPGLWSGGRLLLGGLATIAACAAIAPVSVRGTAAQPPAAPRR